MSAEGRCKLLPLSGERGTSLATTLTEHLLRLHTLLVFIATIQALQFGFEIAVLAASSDCGLFQRSELPEDPECEKELDRIQHVWDIFTMVILVALLFQLVRKVRIVAGHRTHRLPRLLSASVGKMFAERKCALEWVAAGSPDLYAETVASISQTSKLSGMLVLPFAIACTAVRVASLVPVFAGKLSQPASELCGSKKLCAFAHLFGPVFTSWGHYTVLLVYLHITINRAGIWSATMDLAAKRKRSTRIQHFMWLPLTCLLTFSMGVCIALSMVFSVNASSAGVIGLFFGQIMYALCGTLQIFLARIPNDIIKCMAVKIKNHARRLFQGSQEGSQECKQGLISISHFRRDCLGNLSDVLLFANVVVWLEHVPLIRAPVALLVTVFAFRVLILILLLCSRQQQAGFQDIEGSPCFGLVVDARALRRILQEYVAGKPPSLRVPAIPMYKGTLHRMGDTLAVSYRWQGEEAELAPGISLNMSMYQIKAVLEALNRFRNRYVWLDRLSVPQDDQPLKFTLLARMMAVYTAAKVTLAIRTFEESGSRYHERAWTCQEFGIAGRLVVATQEPEPGDTRTALSPECDERMAVLRKRVQTQSFVPLWLRANSGTTALGKVTEISRADGEFILNEFYSLSDHLNCQFPGDRLRALLPLVSCAPLEDHQELVSLVLAISRATGEDLLDWKDSLLKQHRKEKRIIQRNSQKMSGPTKLAVCASWWDGDSPTADEETGLGGSSGSSLNSAWHEWKPESTFRARVMGKVSQESVLEECNQLGGMHSSKSVSAATSAIVPHKKRRPVKRDSTVSNFSEASSHDTKSRGPSRSSTQSRFVSFMSTESPASTSDNTAMLPNQPTDQGGRRRLPAKQKSCLSAPERLSFAPPQSPTRSTSFTSIAVPDLFSFGQGGGLAEQGARRAPPKRRDSLISSIASALSMRPAPDTGQPDDGACVLPPKRDSLFSMIASALSTSSSPRDESTQERLQFIDSASLGAEPEMPGPLSGPDAASGGGTNDTMSNTLSHTSEVSDDFSLPGAADASPAAPGSGFDDSSAKSVMGGSNDVRFIRPVRRSVSQATFLKSSDDSQSREDSSRLPLRLGVQKEITKTPSLPSLRKPPVPEYTPHPALEAEHVTARVSLPSLPPSAGHVGPSANEEWNFTGMLSSFVSKRTPAVPNLSELPESAKPSGSCVVDVPGSRAQPVSFITSSSRRRAPPESSLMSSKDFLGQHRQASSMLAPISDGLAPDVGQQPNGGSSHHSGPEFLMSVEMGARKNDFDGVSANMGTERLGRNKLRRITESESDGDAFASGTLQQFLADAVKHSGF